MTVSLPFMILLSSSLAIACTTTQARPDRIETIGHQLVSHVPGAQIALWRDGALVENRSFGLADIDTRRPVTYDTLFPVYSAAKAWTATSAAILAERRQLNPTAPIAPLVPTGWVIRQRRSRK